MELTRRDLGKIALASVPAVRAFGAKMIDSKFGGVQIGAITYSFNRIASPDPEAIIKAYVEIGLGECRTDVEPLRGAGRRAGDADVRRGGGGVGARGSGGRSRAGRARAGGRVPGGAPGQGGGQRGGRAQLTPEQQAERARGDGEARRSGAPRPTPATWKAVAKKFNDAGDRRRAALLQHAGQHEGRGHRVRLRAWPRAWACKGITTSTTLTMAKRIAPIADKHKLLVGYHGHDATNDPNQTATLESYDTLMGYGKYNGVNLDIGHFTAAGYDAVAFIKEHHDKITNLHVKDRKKDHGPNVAVWGTGDTPIKEVLQLLKKEKYQFPGQPGTGIPDSARIPPSSPRPRSAWRT